MKIQVVCRFFNGKLFIFLMEKTEDVEGTFVGKVEVDGESFEIFVKNIDYGTQNWFTPANVFGQSTGDKTKIAVMEYLQIWYTSPVHSC